MVPAPGFELGTPRLQGGRSGQLSYTGTMDKNYN